MPTRLMARRFTVEQYHRMAEAGVIRPGERVELIDGEVVHMSPVGPDHAGCVNRTNTLLVTMLAGRACLAPQNPVVLDEHDEPQPDLAVLAPRPDAYSSAHPRPEDVLFLIEVCDTTYESDRDEKLPCYARAGIREVWLVNLPERRIEVFRRPTKSGYRSVRRYGRGQASAPLALPDVRIAVNDVLGPR